LYSEGLAALLAAEPSVRVVGAGALDEAALTRIIEADPHILLVDATALRRTDFIHRVRAAVPDALVVACGVSEEREEIIACAEQGAAGYVARDASAEDLVNVVRSVERGELPCSPRIAAMLFRRLATPAQTDRTELGPPLTARERDVIALIDRGLSNKEIAASLGIELATVKNHVHHILEKLDVRRRSAAAARLRQSLAPRPI
jgi:DNA-binding NarL/FixJ family response regulator